MKQTIATTSLFCLLALGASAQSPQEQIAAPIYQTESLETLRRQFAADLRKLRLELLQQSLEFQQWKIKQLERDLQQATSEQQRLLHQESSLLQELAELTKELGNSTTIKPGQTSELEAMKIELNEHELPRLRAAQPAIDQRVSELTEQLRLEETRQRYLQQQATHLKTEQ